MRLRRRLVVQVLLPHENEVWNKHVESILFPCLDEGSTPSSSTQCENKMADNSRQGYLTVNVTLSLLCLLLFFIRDTSQQSSQIVFTLPAYGTNMDTQTERDSQQRHYSWPLAHNDSWQCREYIARGFEFRDEGEAWGQESLQYRVREINASIP